MALMTEYNAASRKDADVMRFCRRSLLPVTISLLMLAGCRESSDVTIRIQLPPSTPIGDTITVAGNHEDLGTWDPSIIRLTRTQAMTAERSFRMPKGLRMEFKATRGSWETEAIFERDGHPPQNTTLMVEGDTTITLAPVGWKDSMPKPSSTLTGSADIHPDLAGKGLRYRRNVIVRLPPSYRSHPDRRYPVLYLHDGQNCFDRSTASFGAEWTVDETMDSLASIGVIEEMILVAMNNTSDRIDEYSDTPLGRSYASFVVVTVKPMVDSLYRTKPQPEHTAVMGSSMGGLISFLFTWWHPEVFGKAACLSSVFDRRRTDVLPLVERTPAQPFQRKIYMDCGGAPGEISLKPGMDEMVEALGKRGMREGQDFAWFFDPAAEHNERAWAQRLWRPMTFLFARPELSTTK
ncbi:MAG: alpha/beta hydrolase-fold protein [Bacteroidetes bacterium]|nr:alpha/beta hydrolase-fold protein [Bacteroidota bacterium]